MPAPRSHVHIQDLVLAVPWIKLELYFSHPVKADTLQPSLAIRLYNGLLGGFDKTAGISKVQWVLPCASRHQCCIRLALLAKRRAGKLILSAPGNALLDKDLIRRNRFVHLRELP